MLNTTARMLKYFICRIIPRYLPNAYYIRSPSRSKQTHQKLRKRFDLQKHLTYVIREAILKLVNKLSQCLPLCWNKEIKSIAISLDGLATMLYINLQWMRNDIFLPCTIILVDDHVIRPFPGLSTRLMRRTEHTQFELPHDSNRVKASIHGLHSIIWVYNYKAR